MSGSGMAPLSTWSLQKVKIGTPYQRPLFMSTRSNVLNSSSHVSFFLQATPWWEGGTLGKVLGVVVAQGTEKKGAATTRTAGVAGTPLLCDRSCHSRSFLSLAFCLIHSSQSVCKYILIGIVDRDSGWKCLVSLISAMRRVRSVLWEGRSSFLGVCRVCFLLLFTSSFSSVC